MDEIPPFPNKPDKARRWASTELRQRKLTRFGNDCSHPNFSLLLNKNGSLLFAEKIKRVKDMSYPADFRVLYDWLYQIKQNPGEKYVDVADEEYLDHGLGLEVSPNNTVVELDQTEMALLDEVLSLEHENVLFPTAEVGCLSGNAIVSLKQEDRLNKKRKRDRVLTPKFDAVNPKSKFETRG